MPNHATGTPTALALLTAMSATLVSLLIACAGGAPDADPVRNSDPLPAQCSNGVAVPNPASNPGLVADCATLLSIKSTLEGSGEWGRKMKWSPDRSVSDWDGVTISDNRVSQLSLPLTLTGHTILYGEIPPELGNLANLTELTIGGEMTGEIPPELGNLTNLTELSIVGDMTGDIPPELGNLVRLTELTIVGDMTGAIPPELGNLSNLTRLIIGRGLTGEIPPELGNLANLEILSLSGNLTGKIPPEIGNLANLTTLDLYANQLTGEIPPELGKLANLAHLPLGNNQLTGAIPPELGNLANLRELHLEINQLTGAIPSELGNLANLEILSLRDNLLTGEIPTELGNLANLWLLDLTNNLLTGEIPEEVSALANDNFKTIEICVEDTASMSSFEGRWSALCLSTNPPDDNDYYARFYTFTLDAPSKVSITLSSDDAKPCLYLLEGEGTDGAVWLQKGAADASPNAITVEKLELQPGSYTIEATTYAPETTGDFTLTMSIRRQ